MFKLRCPDCHAEIKGEPTTYFFRENYCTCGKGWSPYNNFANLVPNWAERSSLYGFEMSRYDNIAKTDPTLYSGYTDTKPQLRAKTILNILKEHQVKEFVELGPGFGELLKIADIPSLAIEQSDGFLEYLDSQQLDTILVKGIAEELPLDDNSVSCFVADGVFQSIINREEFLYELGRVCEKDALIVLTIAHRWNYPRRPQNGFNITKFDEFIVLTNFLNELGFSCRTDWYSLEKESFLSGYGFLKGLEESDYLYVTGIKR